jgi:hypothetical protein
MRVIYYGIPPTQPAGKFMSILHFENKNTSISLESQLELIALESLSIVNLIDRFKNVLPNLTEAIREVTKHLTPTAESNLLKTTQSEYNHLNKKIPHVTFADYERLVVSKPEGFNGVLIEYIIFLNILSTTVYKEMNDVLSQYNFILSSFITNKDDKLSLKDHTSFFKEVSKKRVIHSESLTKFFDPTSTNSVTYLGMMIRRFNDIGPLLSETTKLDKLYQSQNIKQLSSDVSKTVSLLDIIIKNIEEKGITNVSGNASMNISNGAYEIAKYVEFIAVLRFKTEQAIYCIEKLVTSIDTAIK